MYTNSMIRNQPKKLNLMQRIRIKLRLDPPIVKNNVNIQMGSQSMTPDEWDAAMSRLVNNAEKFSKKNRGGDTFGP